MRAWIEIIVVCLDLYTRWIVALFVRAWIEIYEGQVLSKESGVALFVRAWIEIIVHTSAWAINQGRSLRESVD